MSKTPSVTMKGLTFLPVPDFTDVQCAFGADAKDYFMRRDLPEVPRKFTAEAMRMFYEGGAFPEFGDDVDAVKAKRAIKAWLSSWSPSHEAKEATVGYALWVWSPEAAKSRQQAKATA